MPIKREGVFLKNTPSLLKRKKNSLEKKKKEKEKKRKKEKEKASNSPTLPFLTPSCKLLPLLTLRFSCFQLFVSYILTLSLFFSCLFFCFALYIYRNTNRKEKGLWQ